MITVDSDETSVVLKIPKADLSPERLNAFIDWLRLESLVRQSQLDEAEADRIAKEAKTNWWRENKHRFIPDDPN
jgi:hypothetical protein